VAEARSRGGQNAHRQFRADFPDVNLDCPEAAGQLIDQMISLVLRGEIIEKQATTIGYLVTVRRQERASADYERRIEELERALLASRLPAEEEERKR
jgi:hypothetical protein